MNILFLSMRPFQDIIHRSTYHDLWQTFCQEGHEIYVMAPGLEEKIERAIPGLHLLSVNIPSMPSQSMIENVYLTRRSESIYLETFKNKLGNVKFDLILYSTIPAVFLRLINYVKKRDQAVTYLLLKHSLFPKQVEIGLLTKGILNYPYHKYREGQFVKRADYIGLSRPSMLERFRKKYQNLLTSQDFEYTPLSLHANMPALTLRQKQLMRAKFGLPQDRVVFVYKGEIHSKKQLGILKEVIEQNKNNDDFFLILLASGRKLEEFKVYLDNQQFDHAILMADISDERGQDQLLNLSDVGLLINDPQANYPGIQEGLLLYMRASLAILAMDNHPEMQALLFKSQVGYTSSYGDLEHFNHLISLLSLSELRTALGRNGHTYLRQHYHPSLTYQIIMQHFETEVSILETKQLVWEP